MKIRVGDQTRRLFVSIEWRQFVMRASFKSLASLFLSAFLISAGAIIAPVGRVAAGPSIRSNQSGASSPTRRALLIGIGIYNPDQAKPASAAKGNAPARNFPNLDGPKTDLADMRDILSRKYGFTVFHELKDQEATRAAILAAIRKHLIDEASAGDICVFYYSGHGSQVKNTRGGEEDKKDESLVPADFSRGAPDIRDKELARLYLKALEKKIRLTIILDSCHSGSAARGYPSSERTRSAPEVETDVAEEPGFKTPPEAMGALVFSAAQEKEEAKERPYKGVWRGNFSYALLQVLSQPSVSESESAEQIFQRVTSFMRGEMVTHQPVMSGTQERRKSPLFGDARGGTGGATASVVRALDRASIELQGGAAMGLSKDTELKKLSAETNQQAIRLRVTDVKGLNTSEAMVIEGRADAIRPGDLFVIDRWVAPERADLKVWMPTAISRNQIAIIKREASALEGSDRVEWIDDPTVNTPSRVIQFEQGVWKSLTPGGNKETLGPTFSASRLTADASNRSTLFFNFPPPTELINALRIGPKTERQAIEIVASPDEADYILVGRSNDGRLEYAWIRPGVSVEDARTSANPLPVRTDWIEATDAAAEAAAKLGELAVALSRIRAWLQIQGGSNSAFPYSIALRKEGTERIIREGEVREGEQYDIVLVADQTALKRLQDAGQRVRTRKVYVFAIDCQGKSALLFPLRGDDANSYPVEPDKPPLQQPAVVLLGEPGRITLGPPFGLDTYILLTSDERLPDPYVLEFDGVRTKGQSRGEDPELARLIYGLGTATRAARAKVPLNWSIDRMILRSVGTSRPTGRTSCVDEK